jgi:NAD(P)-dependent dehydrogenase (short-subunit alcohol dehydrogenase family)
MYLCILCLLWATNVHSSKTVSRRQSIFLVVNQPFSTDAMSALIGFTRSYSEQLFTDHGIHIHAICPNIVETNIAIYQFYSKLKEFRPALPAPTHSVVNVAQKLVENEGPMSLSNVYKVGPDGVLERQGGLDDRFTEVHGR